jgi:hypothetical protein
LFVTDKSLGWEDRFSYIPLDPPSPSRTLYSLKHLKSAFEMLFKSLLSVAALASKAVATIYYAGVAESGGEFGVYSMTYYPTRVANADP